MRAKQATALQGVEAKAKPPKAEDEYEKKDAKYGVKNDYR